MIIETLLTSPTPDGQPSTARRWVSNGVRRRSSSSHFWKPTTFRNLQATGAAVINLTDDVLLFAQAVTLVCRSLSGSARPGRSRRGPRGRHAPGVRSKWSRSTTPRLAPASSPGWFTGASPRIARLQPGPARRARGRDSRDPDTPDLPGEIRRGLSAAADHRGQDRRPAGTGGDGAAEAAHPRKLTRSTAAMTRPVASSHRRSAGSAPFWHPRSARPSGPALRRNRCGGANAFGPPRGHSATSGSPPKALMPGERRSLPGDTWTRPESASGAHLRVTRSHSRPRRAWVRDPTGPSGRPGARGVVRPAR